MEEKAFEKLMITKKTFMLFIVQNLRTSEENIVHSTVCWIFMQINSF
jgi:hypothetical protein